jgi:D-alanyl-D-alanine carboxypeptidase/D-alanyl-D-alanine-endopeptidase (penicillin-binding protein 4)
MKRHGVWVLVAAVMALPASAADTSPVELILAGLVNRFRTETGASVGVHVLRLRDNSVIFDHGGRKPLMPASNMKIVTSAVAFQRLGPEFCFQTILARDGADIGVYGDGDPTTGDPRIAQAAGQSIYAVFDKWAAALTDAGIKQIKGNLVIHAGIFQNAYFHPDWAQKHRGVWYGAPVAGVNFNDNCVNVTFAVKDKAIQPQVVPEGRFLKIVNQTKPGKHAWGGRFSQDGLTLTLSGTVAGASAEPVCVPAPNPTVLYATVLADRLLNAGIELKGKILVSLEPADAAGPGEKSQVIITETTPLAEPLARCNKQSLNMMAECIFLRCGVEKASPSDWKIAAKTAQEVLAKDYGISAGEASVADGSGLGRDNRVSPAALTAILWRLAGQKVFTDSLAIGGVDGSLERRFNDERFRGRVIAKTGSIAGVSSLSGYVLNKQAQPALAFSVLINGNIWGKTMNAHALQDAICMALVRDLDGPPASAPAATKKAR